MLKETLNKLFKHRSRGDVIVFFASLLLALLVWGILKFSATYTSIYNYKIKLSTTLPGRDFSAVSEEAVTITGKSTGFAIVRQRMAQKSGKNLLRFSAAPALFRPCGDDPDRFYVLTKYLKDNIVSKISDQITVDGISTDTLFFIFKKTNYKLVPVVLDSDFTYREQYMPFGAAKINPDFVEIHGAEELLNNIDSVKTQTIKKRNLHHDEQGFVRLESLSGVTFSNSGVYYIQRVGRYFESSLVVPVYINDMPPTENMILSPSSVTLTYRQDYSVESEYLPSDFHAYVDYEQVIKSQAGLAKIQLRSLPTGVYSVNVKPEFVDAIVLTHDYPSSTK